jgi:hypothetical protein
MIGNRIVVDVRQTAIIRITAIEAIVTVLENLSDSIHATDNLVILKIKKSI